MPPKRTNETFKKKMPPKRSCFEIFKKKSQALHSAELDARIVGGPLRVDWLCAPNGERCVHGFEICRLFDLHRLSQLEPGIIPPNEIIRNRQKARNRINGHISKKNHDANNHRHFVNSFYQVANEYTHNGISTRYVLIQFHQSGHPLLGETRSHFHIRPAWIENGQFQYDDHATPELYNFTPAEHYYYEVDDMNDYWFEEETTGQCRDNKRQHSDEDDQDSPPGASSNERGRKKSKNTEKRSRSKNNNKSNSESKNNSGSNNNSSSSGSNNNRSSSPPKCHCKLIGIASAATKCVAKKQAVKVVTKQIIKSGGKSIAKKIPILGAFVGLGFGAVRCLQGDFKGAVGEVASGAASCVPVAGTLASVAIDVGLVARDLSTATDPHFPFMIERCKHCGKIK